MTSSTTPSRRRSSASSAPARATWASTRPPTPSTTGPGTASWWARTSATTRPARRPRPSSREDTDDPSTPASRTAGADGRVVQLPIASQPGGQRRRYDYSPRNTPGVHVLLKMDESTYDEDDGNTAPTTITRSRGASATTAVARGTPAWATRRPRTRRRASSSHIEAGIEIAAGVLPSAACGVAPAPPGTDVPVTVGGTVPERARADARRRVARHVHAGRRPDYTASVAATVTSSAIAAQLSVRTRARPPRAGSSTARAALPQPLQSTPRTRHARRSRRSPPRARRCRCSTFRDPVGAHAGDDRLQAADRRHRQPAVEATTPRR